MAQLRTRRTTTLAAALAALASLAGVASSQGAGQPEPAPAAAKRAAKAPKVKLAIPLSGVEVSRGSRRKVMRARPTGTGSVHWLRPRQKPRRLDARAVATVLEGVHEHDRERVRVGAHSISIGPPKLTRRGVLVARIRGARPALSQSLTLRATIIHTDRRTTDGCVLAPFASCRNAELALEDLHRADLRGADLRGASLHSAWAHDIELAGADLRGADLRAATLSAADLRATRLRGAHLADANLRRAKVSPRQLRKAHLCDTRLPSGKLRTRDCDEPAPALKPPSSPRVDTAAALASGREGPARRDAGGAPRQSLEESRKGGVTPTAPRVAGVRRGGGDCPYPAQRDGDSDGLADCTELSGWSLPVRSPAELGGDGKAISERVSSKVGAPDSDRDGVLDGDEFRASGDPRDPDTDEDQVIDEDEFTTFRSALNDADTDDDSKPPGAGARVSSLFDRGEARTLRTSLRDPDTDGDSLSDYHETVIGDTSPAMADLPTVAIRADTSAAAVRIDIPYEVVETTGTTREVATTTQTSNEQTTTSERSRATSHEVTNSSSQSASCGGSVSIDAGEAGCKVSKNWSHEVTDSFTRGSSFSFDNSQQVTDENEAMQATSAERQVTVLSGACMQARLVLENQGDVAVKVGNLQVLASVFDGDGGEDKSRFITALRPVSGEVYTANCPATDTGFGEKTIPAHGSIEVGFAQTMSSPDAQDLLAYMRGPKPIEFTPGPITLQGTNLAGDQVDFLGEVAGKVAQQDASVTVEFGDGTLSEYTIAAGTRFDAKGKPVGISLEDALGASFAGLSPKFTARGDGNPPAPSVLSALTNPETGRVVANAPDRRDGAWFLVGDAGGMDDPEADWGDVRLRPGDAIELAYSRDTDRDGAFDDLEAQIGTDPDKNDTDGDDLNDFVEGVTGFTVPRISAGKPEFKVLPSPLSCDGDGDGSPDGPGPGNATYGECPRSPHPPESVRAMTTGDAPSGGGLRALSALEGTDPTDADTNGDGLLDGRQPFPDVLKQVGKGQRVPIWLRQWGGPGPGDGTFTSAQAIAVDHNQPMRTSAGFQPIDSYVIDRVGTTACGPIGCTDRVQKFTGNPLVETPAYNGDKPDGAPGLMPNAADYAGNIVGPMAATGVAVASGQTGSGDAAGSPVVVNYYPKLTSSIRDANKPLHLLTTYNGRSLEDTFKPGSHSPLAFMYGGGCCGFQTPLFSTRRIGNGFLDVTASRTAVIGHGPGGTAAANQKQSDARPTEYPSGDPAHRVQFGRKGAPGGADPEKDVLVDPSGVAIDRTAGKLYVGDDLVGPDTGTSKTGTLSRFDLTDHTNAEEFLRLDDGTLSKVRGVAVDPSGDYVYAVAGDSILKLSNSLSILARFGGPAPTGAPLGRGIVGDPWDVDVDAEHGVWATDRESNLVQYFFYPFGPD